VEFADDAFTIAVALSLLASAERIPADATKVVRVSGNVTSELLGSSTLNGSALAVAICVGAGADPREGKAGSITVNNVATLELPPFAPLDGGEVTAVEGAPMLPPPPQAESDVAAENAISRSAKWRNLIAVLRLIKIDA